MVDLIPPEHAGARKCGDGNVTAHRADGQPPRVGSVDAHLLYTLCSRAEIIKIRLLSSLMVSSGATRLAAAAASASIARVVWLSSKFCLGGGEGIGEHLGLLGKTLHASGTQSRLESRDRTEISRTQGLHDRFLCRLVVQCLWRSCTHQITRTREPRAARHLCTRSGNLVQRPATDAVGCVPLARGCREAGHHASLRCVGTEQRGEGHL